MVRSERNVLFQVKRAFEHRQTRIIEEIKRTIFESLFVFNVAYMPKLEVRSVPPCYGCWCPFIDSFMFLEMLADFPGHPGPGDVYQYPISNLTCQTISNRRTGVYLDTTMALPLKVHRYLPWWTWILFERNVCVTRLQVCGWRQNRFKSWDPSPAAWVCVRKKYAGVEIRILRG